MDKIFIRALQLDALIGVYAHERQAPQPLLLDVELDFDNRISASSDALADTIDYAAVVAQLRQWTAQTHYALLETLLEDMAARLRAGFPSISKVRLRVHKPLAAKALGCADVGIEIER
ncbi:dihydroneopterin aldolase [Lysobacteraceae bacterium NML120232]|nr:dihydroneopterin aldolase [Xanthomonadaceae bacterium NML08-0793]PJK09757.1 dihydroneopterin aldolase [Xanthomonadaceae bacterium NML120232]